MYSKLLNIKLVDMDVTGGTVKWAWEFAKGKRKLFDFGMLPKMDVQAGKSLSNNYQFIA